MCLSFPMYFSPTHTHWNSDFSHSCLLRITKKSHIKLLWNNLKTTSIWASHMLSVEQATTCHIACVGDWVWVWRAVLCCIISLSFSPALCLYSLLHYPIKVLILFKIILKKRDQMMCAHFGLFLSQIWVTLFVGSQLCVRCVIADPRASTCWILCLLEF